MPNDTWNVPDTTGRTSIGHRQVVFVKSRWSAHLWKLSTLHKSPTDPRWLSRHMSGGKDGLVAGQGEARRATRRETAERQTTDAVDRSCITDVTECVRACVCVCMRVCGWCRQLGKMSHDARRLLGRRWPMGGGMNE